MPALSANPISAANVGGTHRRPKRSLVLQFVSVIFVFLPLIGAIPATVCDSIMMAHSVIECTWLARGLLTLVLGPPGRSDGPMGQI